MPYLKYPFQDNEYHRHTTTNEANVELGSTGAEGVSCKKWKGILTNIP